MVNIFEHTEFTGAFEDARQAGFNHGQVNVCLPKVTPDEIRLLALAAKNEGFHVDAVGCYINPLRQTDDSLSFVDINDWRCVAENMAMLNGVERIVCWSGTLGKTLSTPNLLNHQEDTFNRLFMALHVMTELVRGFRVEILIEPFSAHVLHDASSCVRLANQFPAGEVRMVMDAPNVVSRKDFQHRDQVIAEHIEQIAPAVGLVHLKDMARDHNDHRQFPYAGAGAINYAKYLNSILVHLPEVPVIVDNVPTVAEAIAAREFIQEVLFHEGL